MKYTDRQVSRGFGFCIFENPQSAELAMRTKVHTIDGRKVLPIAERDDFRWMCAGLFPRKWLLLHSRQVRAALPADSVGDQQTKPITRKVFVGGLSVDTTDGHPVPASSSVEDLLKYFSKFGEIESASVMYHHDKHHSRGFGFVLFRNGSSVNEVMQRGPHVICGKTVLLFLLSHA